jgi:hypothetical protein
MIGNIEATLPIDCGLDSDSNGLAGADGPSEHIGRQAEIDGVREAFVRWARKQKFTDNSAKAAADCVPSNLRAAAGSLAVRQRLARDLALIEGASR